MHRIVIFTGVRRPPAQAQGQRALARRLLVPVVPLGLDDSRLGLNSEILTKICCSSADMALLNGIGISSHHATELAS